MSDSGPRRLGVSIELQPHAYDPATDPELFDGVLSRRVVAFIIDLFVLAAPVVLILLFILIFGFVTFGLGWKLLWLVWPGTVIWALLYYGFCFGGPASATIGMRTMDLEMRTWYGDPAYFLLGAVHAIVFWIAISVLTPLILIVGLLNSRRRLLHDILVGTVIINNKVRSEALRRAAGRV